jgi:hypothetical protein
MPHPKVRTWTLKTLDRNRGYRLWFDRQTFRWEVCLAEGDTVPLTTRATPPSGPDRAGPPHRRSEATRAGVRGAGRRRGDLGAGAA